jgi:hypothetical protein
MTLREGPLFGAVVITVGVTYLVHQQTGSITKALLIGGAVGAADYILLSIFGRRRK